MIELTKNNLTLAVGKGASKVSNGSYDVNTLKLEKDVYELERIQKNMDTAQLSPEEAALLKKTIWTLRKWMGVKKVKIDIQYLDGKLYFRDTETECGGTTVLHGTGKYNEIVEKLELTGDMTVKYITKENHHVVIVDYSELADAIAFEYLLADICMDTKTLQAWTNSATIYSVNDSKILRDMIKTEMETDVKGATFDLACKLMVNPACLKVQLNGEKIFSYLGNKVDIPKRAPVLKRLYNKVLTVSAHEVLGTLIGALGNSTISRDVQVIGFTDKMQLALMVNDSITDSKLIDEVSVVGRIIQKRYLFTPDIFSYSTSLDKFTHINKRED